ILCCDTTATRFEQHVLGVVVTLVLLAHLLRADAEERAIVLGCVVFSAAAELFCTQVWGLYVYRFGNVPAYVPPGHGLLCMVSLGTAKIRFSLGARRALMLGVSV